MADKLIIVESPAKANTIKKFLGGSTKVVASMGHIRDFPKSTVKDIEIETNISEVAIVNILDEFVERGIVEESGRGKSKGYVLSPKIYKVKNKKSKISSSNEELEDMIVDFARRKKEGISRSDVVSLLDVGGDKAYNLLKKLVKDGRLRVEKNGRYTRYFV